MRLGNGSATQQERIPHLRPGVDPAGLSLTPAEGYLLSRIDGTTPWTLLRSIGGIGPDEVDRCLERWVAEGVVTVVVSAAAPGAAAVLDSSHARSGDTDPSLDIPVEVQLRILDFEARLESPYHEILGVARDADRKILRKAYFALSRELHPDRFFRRNTGSFGKRLERIFGKIVEAYELLSDPTARAEIERSLAAAGGSTPSAETVQPAETAQPAEAAAEAAQQKPAAGPRVPRRPHVFSLHSRVLRDRKARAKRFFEAGMASHAAGRWVEAAGSVRLAIAFDPWNAIYKEHFVAVQRRAQDERAQRLLKEAESALELRDFKVALRAFDDAIQLRPHDAELLHRAAKLAWMTGGDLRQAKEWAMAAVEIDPKQGGHHRLLGQVYQAAGLEANARRELEAALALDASDEEARTALREIGGRPLGLRWLGGKR
ncbi:MAG: DnaJ domain-containing protein [Myxococcota bacterium]|jgi:curved DNA-binding protein CbpA|nr:DnaJ domain-containing protein [Myxococcota bacterium]